MEYHCPLCGQIVTLSQYNRITGIWKEREKLLSKIREERMKLAKKSADFRKRRAQLVQQAVQKQTKLLESKIRSLKFSQRQLQSSAQQEIHQATLQAKKLQGKLREKLLRRIDEQRTDFERRIGNEQERLRKESIKLRTQKARLVQQISKTQKRKLETRLKALRLREARIEERTIEKIRRVTAAAHERAERIAAMRVNSLKRELRNQLKNERERSAREVRIKYRRLNNTFRSTLIQMKAKTTQIKEQTRQIRELEKQLRRQTTPQIEGLLSEDILLKELKKRFPQDKFLHTGKGGDILHELMRNGQPAGLIVYECKRVKHYSASHVQQALDAKEKRKADFAILVTNAMKKRTQGFFTERGVVIVHPAGLLSFVSILRGQMIHIAEMKLGQRERDKAIKMTLEYLEGPQFANSMDAIVEESIKLYRDLLDEVGKHIATWKRRYSSYNKVHEEALSVKGTSKALLSGEPEYKQIQTETFPALPDMPEVEKTTADVEKSDREGPARAASHRS